MFVISTEGGAVVRVPMKPRFVPTCAVEFSRSVNYFGRVFSRLLNAHAYTE
jgi:hypothetical protein